MTGFAIAIWLICGLLAAIVASSKGHGVGAWFLVGFLFGPLGLLAAVGMGSKNTAAAAQDSSNAVSVAAAQAQTEHEHSWVAVPRIDDEDPRVITRCEQCGFIKSTHQHSWGPALLSRKYRDRLYQDCSSCDAARYLDDAPPSCIDSSDHQWSTNRVDSPLLEKNFTLTLCRSCGIISEGPHQHRWSDPLPSQKFEGRHYQECVDCKVARYID